MSPVRRNVAWFVGICGAVMLVAGLYSKSTEPLAGALICAIFVTVLLVDRGD